MNVRKSLSLLTAAALLAATAAACGTAPAAASSQAPASSPAASSAPASAAPEPAKEIDLVIVKNQLTDGIKEQQVKDAISAKIEEDLGMKITFKVITAPEVDALNQKIYLMSASGEQMDMISNHNVQLSNLLSKPGLIAPIDDLLDQYGANLKKHVPAETFDRFRLNGELMAIPDNDGDTVQDGIIVRKDWLDKLNLPVPRTLQQFEEMLQAFQTQDPDGNGKNDTIPLVAQENRMNLCFAPIVTGLAPSTFTFPGIWDYYDEASGEVRPTFIAPEYKKQLEFIKGWYDKGWLNKDFLITTGDQNREMFKQGKAGAYADTWWLIEMEGDMKKALGDEVELAAITSLSGENGEMWFGRLKTSGIIAIPESSKYKAEMIQVLDWMVSSKENYRLCKYGILGETYIEVGENQWDLPSADANPNQYSKFFTSVVIPEYELYPASAPDNYLEMKAFVNSPDRKVVYGAADGITVVFDEYKKVQAQCDTLRKERLTKMATGAESIDNFDQFVEEWRSMGGDAYIKEKTAAYNAYYESLKK